MTARRPLGPQRTLGRPAPFRSTIPTVDRYIANEHDPYVSGTIPLGTAGAVTSMLTQPGPIRQEAVAPAGSKPLAAMNGSLCPFASSDRRRDGQRTWRPPSEGGDQKGMTTIPATSGPLDDARQAVDRRTALG